VPILRCFAAFAEGRVEASTHGGMVAAAASPCRTARLLTPMDCSRIWLPDLIGSVAQVCGQKEWAMPKSRRGSGRTGNLAILQVVMQRPREPAGNESSAEQERTS
jgi:hypothetical protein